MTTAWPNHDKRKYRDRLRRAIKNHKLTPGTGWERESGKGCLVGSLCREYSHYKLGDEIGAPPTVIYLFDSIFEGLSKYDRDDGAQFGLNAVAAIKEGADLSLVWPRVALWMLTHERLVKAASADERCAKAVADFYYQLTTEADREDLSRLVRTLACGNEDDAIHIAIGFILGSSRSWKSVDYFTNHMLSLPDGAAISILTETTT